MRRGPAWRGGAAALALLCGLAAPALAEEGGELAPYQMVRSLFENFQDFKTLHFVFATLDKERMIKSGLTAPLHPGAERYFREQGLLQ